MPSKKAHRVSERRRKSNRAILTRTRTRLANAHQQMTSGSATEVEEAVREAASALDRAASKGILHPNNAARRKSRLMRQLNAFQGGAVEK